LATAENNADHGERAEQVYAAAEMVVETFMKSQKVVAMLNVPTELCANSVDTRTTPLTQYIVK